jgi:30S ribosomal protein S31
MGKGDKKSRKGKRFRGSFGKTRPKKEKKIKAKLKKETGG